MNTKNQQAQEYAEKYLTDICLMMDYEEDKQIGYFHTYDIQKAYSDGYTACEQSMWRSVEEELPSNDDNVLVYVPSTEFRIGGYEVAYYDGEDWYTSDGEHIRPTHFMYIPSLPDTNTEKH